MCALDGGKKRHGQRDEQGEYRITWINIFRDLNIIWVCGELYAATKGNRGGCRRKESSTVHLEDSIEYIYDTILCF